MQPRRGVAIIALFGLCSPAFAQNAPAKNLPPDVAAFITRAEECNHWAGEEPYKARAGEIDRAMTRLRCDALDADAAALRRRHAGDPHALAALDKAREQFQ